MNVLKIETAAEMACVPTPRAATFVPVTRAMNSPPTNLLVWVSTCISFIQFCDWHVSVVNICKIVKTAIRFSFLINFQCIFCKHDNSFHRDLFTMYINIQNDRKMSGIHVFDLVVFLFLFVNGQVYWYLQSYSHILTRSVEHQTRFCI